MSTVSELFNETTGIYAAAGYAAGIIMEEKARLNIRGVRALIRGHRNVGPSQLGSSALSTLAATGLLAGYAVGLAESPHGPLPNKKPVVAGLVSHTVYSEADGANNLLNTVATDIDGSHSLNVQLWLSRNNNTSLNLASAAQVRSDVALGDSGGLGTSVPEALADAYGSAPQGHSNIPGVDSQRRSAATIVFADGEKIGKQGLDAIQSAAHTEGDQPVYVVDSGNSHDLQTVAGETGGHYYHVTKANESSLATTLEASVTPHEAPVPQDPAQEAGYLLLGTLVAASGLRYFVLRSRRPEMGEGHVS